MYQEITIQFTQYCNLSCPYCFAEKNGKALTEHDFDLFLTFCRRNRPDCIHVTGGEPTLHHMFLPWLRQLSDVADVVVYSNFTNPLWNSALLDSMHGGVSFLVNINEDTVYGPSQRQTIERNIDWAMDHGARIAVGLTIYKRGYQHFIESTVNYMVEKSISNLRLSQSLVCKDSTMVLSRADIKELYAYVANHIDCWSSRGINAYFDCPVPPCYVDPSVFRKLRENNAVTVFCRPKAFVLSDLSVTHCYSTINEDDRLRLDYFETIDEIKEHSLTVLKNALSNRGRPLKCAECSQLSVLPCGCPSYTIGN